MSGFRYDARPSLLTSPVAASLYLAGCAVGAVVGWALAKAEEAQHGGR